MIRKQVETKNGEWIFYLSYITIRNIWFNLIPKFNFGYNHYKENKMIQLNGFVKDEGHLEIVLFVISFSYSFTNFYKK